jgi:hypothetical protein
MDWLCLKLMDFQKIDIGLETFDKSCYQNLQSKVNLSLGGDQRWNIANDDFQVSTP